VKVSAACLTDLREARSRGRNSIFASGTKDLIEAIARCALDSSRAPRYIFAGLCFDS